MGFKHSGGRLFVTSETILSVRLGNLEPGTWLRVACNVSLACLSWVLACLSRETDPGEQKSRPSLLLWTDLREREERREKGSIPQVRVTPSKALPGVAMDTN
ncbi:hypothetical protein CGLO_00518 [Colletotrichum gloeosporioides Cg-14]|uniref:Uncharacterized protein n=1 Tax=Colletotrichum gloeosporioides (strain Cg-14) TaxID=1237896 RepID=T0M6P1_COLGC|nr:hypothetical protein CGLO_00518 [Colletotrichum gloeosporioides Cg-14]